MTLCRGARGGRVALGVEGGFRELSLPQWAWVGDFYPAYCLFFGYPLLFGFCSIGLVLLLYYIAGFSTSMVLVLYCT